MRERRSRRVIVAVGAVAVAVLAAMLAVVQGVGPRVSDIWPLDLARQGGWLVDFQIRDLRKDAALCTRVLKEPQIEAKAVPDQTPSAQCGWSNAYTVVSAGGAEVRANVATCQLAAALALWMEHVVQEKAREHLGRRVASIRHYGTYACRNIRGSAALAGSRSQHALANAIDVREFVLADGRRISVKRHWGGDGAESRFLADVHRGACRYFRVAIGPAYNAAHHDNFHFDRGPWRACR